MTVKLVKMKCPQCEHIFLPSKEEIQSRTGRSSRTKGAAFERKVAKMLQAWWPGNHEFRRTPMSGGSVLKLGWDMAGDICTTAPDFKWHLELKNSSSKFSGLHQLLSAEKSTVWEWFTQAVTECPAHKRPLLIFNRNDQPTYCMAMSTALLFYENDKSIQQSHRLTYIPHYIIGARSIWLLKDMLASNPELWK